MNYCTNPNREKAKNLQLSQRAVLDLGRSGTVIMVDPSLYSPLNSESPNSLMTNELDFFYSTDLHFKNNMSEFKKPSVVNKTHNMTPIKLEIDSKLEILPNDIGMNIYNSKTGLISPSFENLTMDKCVEFLKSSKVDSANSANGNKCISDEIDFIKSKFNNNVNNNNNNNNNYVCINYKNNHIDNMHDGQDIKFDPSKLNEFSTENLSISPEEFDYFSPDGYLQPTNVDLFDGELLNLQQNYQNNYNNILDDNILILNPINGNNNNNVNNVNNHNINANNSNVGNFITYNINSHNECNDNNNNNNNNSNLASFNNNTNINNMNALNTLLNYAILEQRDLNFHNNNANNSNININNKNNVNVINHNNNNNNNNNNTSNHINNDVNLTNLDESDQAQVVTLNMEDLRCLLENAGDKILLEIVGDQIILNSDVNIDGDGVNCNNNNYLINNNNNNNNNTTSNSNNNINNNIFYFADLNDNNVNNNNNNNNLNSIPPLNNNQVIKLNNNNNNTNNNNANNNLFYNNNNNNNDNYTDVNKTYLQNYLPTSPPPSAKKPSLLTDDINNNNTFACYDDNIWDCKEYDHDMTLTTIAENDNHNDDDARNDVVDENDDDEDNNDNDVNGGGGGGGGDGGVRAFTYDKPNLRKRRKRQISEASSCFTADGSDEDLSDSDDDASEFIADLKSSGSQQQRYFWQYNVLSKGPKGRRLCHSIETSDPHVLGDFEDPVFHQELQDKYKHNGKARRGDGNDVTPNPQRLFNTGMELQKLNKQIMQMAPSNDWSTAYKNKVIKERNKLASRACRLKKKAQHEANKLKLHGLKLEHHQLMKILSSIRSLISTRLNEGDKYDINLTQQLALLIKKHHTLNVAGKTAEFVNGVLDKVALGDKSGGIHLKN